MEDKDNLKKTAEELIEELKKENERQQPHMFQKYFKGKNLEEEFAYANYYHNHKLNCYLHVISFITTFFIVVNIFAVNVHPIIGIITSGFLYFVYSRMHKTSAIVYFGFMVCGVHFSRFIQIDIVNGLLIIIGFLLLQLIGHIVFQGERPAFRIFEALVTTPNIVMLVFLSDMLGLNTEYVQQIQKLTSMWSTKDINNENTKEKVN